MKVAAGLAAAAAPVVSRLAFDGPAVPIAGATVLGAYLLGKTHAAPPALAEGAFFGGCIGLAFSVLYNLRGASSMLVQASNPDSLRGVG